MIGTFYGVPVIVDLVQDVLKRAFHDLDANTVFHFLAQFKDPLIREQSDTIPPGYQSPTPEDMRSAVQDGLEALKKSQVLFVGTIIERFNSLLQDKKTEFLSSITPWLLIQVLTQMDNPLPNSELVELIEAFVVRCPKRLLTKDDLNAFNSLIRWDDEAVYPFFLKYELDWVDPVTARRCLATIQQKRSQTLQAFDVHTQNLTLTTPISPWFAWSWLQAIHDSAGAVEQPEVELLEFIGTFGNAGAPCNPITLGFIQNCSTPSIGARANREKGVGAQILFDASLTPQERERWHYTSRPNQNPFVGFKLLGFLFYPTFVTFDFHGTNGTVYRGPSAIRLEIKNGERVVTEETKVGFDGSAIIQVKKPIPFSDLKIEMMGNTGDQILRVSSLKVNGFFLPDIEVESQ